MECIDDDDGRPVAAFATIRPELKNKEPRCVFARLALGQANLSFAFRSEAVLPGATLTERQTEASRYLTCWPPFLVRIVVIDERTARLNV